MRAGASHSGHDSIELGFVAVVEPSQPVRLEVSCQVTENERPSAKIEGGRAPWLFTGTPKLICAGSGASATGVEDHTGSESVPGCSFATAVALVNEAAPKFGQRHHCAPAACETERGGLRNPLGGGRIERRDRAERLREALVCAQVLQADYDLRTRDEDRASDAISWTNLQLDGDGTCRDELVPGRVRRLPAAVAVTLGAYLFQRKRGVLRAAEPDPECRRGPRPPSTSASAGPTTLQRRLNDNPVVVDGCAAAGAVAT